MKIEVATEPLTTTIIEVTKTFLIAFVAATATGSIALIVARSNNCETATSGATIAALALTAIYLIKRGH